MARPKSKKYEPPTNKGAISLAYMRGEKELKKVEHKQRNNPYLPPSALEFIDRQLELERKAKEK